MPISPRQAAISLSSMNSVEPTQGLQYDTTRHYREMPSLKSIMKGLKGEADYAAMHPLLPILQAKFSSVSDTYRALGKDQALRDFGLI